jgi:uncharacterized protein YbaR (Trm112 family)/SAM-dependent methyltransferase
MADIIVQGNRKVSIPQRVLEQSLEYLVCPDDNQQLRLDIGNRESVDEGMFSCIECSQTFEIENGIPRFVKPATNYKWQVQGKEEETYIAELIQKSAGDPLTMRAQVLSLGPLLYNSFGGDRLQAIRKLFDIVTKVINTGNLSMDNQVMLLSAANEARYDLEIYRNALIAPFNILSAAFRNYDKGIVVEGGCATGDCLLYAATALPAPFYIGADISANLLLQAQSKAGENTLFVQADVQSLPLRNNCAGMLIGQNIWDRLADPPKAVGEIARVLDKKGSVILSQCDPPQYESEDGRIVYVPKEKRLSLRQIIEKLGFKVAAYQRVIWTPWTIYDGQETLPTDSFYASNLNL